jgi:phage repressor protein C with HTH and peptisase S24 domain
MVPTLRPGDRLLVRYGADVFAGDLVLARYPDGTLAVKRAAYVAGIRSGGPGWFLLSDNPAEGVDSRHRGAFAPDAVIAVVRLRLWPRPGRV